MQSKERKKKVVEEEGKDGREGGAGSEAIEGRNDGRERHEKKGWNKRRESPNKTWRKKEAGEEVFEVRKNQ